MWKPLPFDATDDCTWLWRALHRSGAQRDPNIDLLTDKSCKKPEASRGPAYCHHRFVCDAKNYRYIWYIHRTTIRYRINYFFLHQEILGFIFERREASDSVIWNSCLMRVIYASTLYQSPHEMILTSKEYFFIYYVYLAKKNYIISKIGHQINSLFLWT